MQIFLGIIPFCILLFGCSQETNGQKMKDVLGEDVTRQILNPAQVEAIAVEPDLQSVRGYRMKGHQQKLTSTQIQHLQSLLLDQKGYVLDKHKRCVFMPNAAFLFSDNAPLVVLVGTSCQQIKFIIRDKSVIIDFEAVQKPWEQFIQGLNLNHE